MCEKSQSEIIISFDDDNKVVINDSYLSEKVSDFTHFLTHFESHFKVLSFILDGRLSNSIDSEVISMLYSESDNDVLSVLSNCITIDFDNLLLNFYSFIYNTYSIVLKGNPVCIYDIDNRFLYDFTVSGSVVKVSRLDLNFLPFDLSSVNYVLYDTLCNDVLNLLNKGVV